MNPSFGAIVGAWLGRGFILILLLTLAWLHCSSSIAFVTADLGRHIRNGEIFIRAHQILATNFYSYTASDFPTMCHHWASGVVFYLVEQWGGLLLLSAFFTAMLVKTFAIFTWAAWRQAGFWPAVLMAAIALPLVGYRVEIRPEGFTTFFLAIEFFLLMAYRDGRVSARWLWVIPLVQWAWINAHILFFMGFALLFFFIVDLLVNDKAGARWRPLLLIAGASVAVSLMNPFGLQGLLEPLNIFKAYGYKLAENQNVFFMIQRFPGHAVYGYFLACSGLIILLLALRFFKERRWQAILLDVMLLAFFGLMAFKTVRAIAAFGFLFIPLCAVQLACVIRLYGGKWEEAFRRAIMLAGAAFILLAAAVPYFFLSPFHSSRFALGGLEQKFRSSLFMVLASPKAWGGLSADIGASADFFKAQRMRGPIFNNYDIGGYLIYYLFPQERPFVDNRPEAYPVEFFEQVYAPMQEDEKVWEAMQKQYGFEVIYFYRHDQTSWAQPFLLRRIDDPAWAPVFVDGYTIIFARRGGVNHKVIERFELPRSMFSSTSGASR